MSEKTKLITIIEKINTVTEKEDETVYDAVDSLIEKAEAPVSADAFFDLIYGLPDEESEVENNE